MNRKFATATILTCIAAISGLILSSNENVHAASDTGRNSDAPAAPASDWEFLNRMLQPEKPAGTVGPVRGELESALSSRSVIERDDERLSTVPTVSGGTCFTASRASRRLNSGCFEHIPASGVVASYMAAEKDDTQLSFDIVGFTGDGVEDVVVTTASGTSFDLPIEHGAFWWTSPDATDEVVSLSWTRDGDAHSETRLFD